MKRLALIVFCGILATNLWAGEAEEIELLQKNAAIMRAKAQEIRERLQKKEAKKQEKGQPKIEQKPQEE